MSSSVSRKTGRVKFFNSTKGYGFIIPDDPMGPSDVEEVFVHHTAIHNNGGFKSLGEAEEVEYDLVQGAKGMQAANVTGIGGGPVKGDPRASRSHYQSGHGFGSGGGGGRQQMFNGGYMDPYSTAYGYPVPSGYSYGGAPSGNQPPPFQYGLPVYSGMNQPPFGYPPPPFMNQPHPSPLHQQQQQQQAQQPPQQPPSLGSPLQHAFNPSGPSTPSDH
ncbi:cold-shock' DNA-binding domain-containing protein [Gongronella butleri]|nr:cold-shock' DNA-binding domain-containing protein [Gongronella butleri]